MDGSQAAAGTSCCDGGYCSVSGCFPFSALSSLELTLALSSAQTLTPARGVPPVTSRPETLYRPPIVP